jgi:hypothetical protein
MIEISKFNNKITDVISAIENAESYKQRLELLDQLNKIRKFLNDLEIHLYNFRNLELNSESI